MYNKLGNLPGSHVARTSMYYSNLKNRKT